MPFTCHQCNSYFPLKQSFDRHIKYKHGNNSFKCDQCQKSFTRKDILLRHLRIHDTNNSIRDLSNRETVPTNIHRVENNSISTVRNINEPINNQGSWPENAIPSRCEKQVETKDFSESDPDTGSENDETDEELEDDSQSEKRGGHKDIFSETSDADSETDRESENGEEIDTQSKKLGGHKDIFSETSDSDPETTSEEESETDETDDDNSDSEKEEDETTDSEEDESTESMTDEDEETDGDIEDETDDENNVSMSEDEGETDGENSSDMDTSYVESDIEDSCTCDTCCKQDEWFGPQSVRKNVEPCVYKDYYIKQANGSCCIARYGEGKFSNLSRTCTVLH